MAKTIATGVVVGQVPEHDCCALNFAVRNSLQCLLQPWRGLRPSCCCRADEPWLASAALCYLRVCNHHLIQVEAPRGEAILLGCNGLWQDPLGKQPVFQKQPRILAQQAVLLGQASVLGNQALQGAVAARLVPTRAHGQRRDSGRGWEPAVPVAAVLGGRRAGRGAAGDARGEVVLTGPGAARRRASTPPGSALATWIAVAQAVELEVDLARSLRRPALLGLPQWPLSRVATAIGEARVEPARRRKPSCGAAPPSAAATNSMKVRLTTRPGVPPRAAANGCASSSKPTIAIR
eukprot:CAMPEP_0179172146 /NCGR_PEP_ID=MMETSP0796-20121207/84891_1 /TAXON_ID=73915 /ORGANISM="Pyrodinium bahamense, Strain pbaha01" /LENGTH=291 /DNA_ID=CAMNT_0020875271 /DNA_START=577 /DNA_END=1452 /DNA_ORIENTATION=+